MDYTATETQHWDIDADLGDVGSSSTASPLTVQAPSFPSLVSSSIGFQTGGTQGGERGALVYLSWGDWQGRFGGCCDWEAREAFYGKFRQLLYSQSPSLWLLMVDPNEKRQSMVLRHLLPWQKAFE